jgi:predicted kinase
MEQNTLIMLCGLPRSGKTTFASSLPYPRVNPDSIRLAFHGHKFIAPAEPWVWLFAKTMVRALFFSDHKKIILDATNINRSRRDEWKSKSWNRKLIIFPTDIGTCLERADKELIPVIHDMALKMELPDEEECKTFEEVIIHKENGDYKKRELL